MILKIVLNNSNCLTFVCLKLIYWLAFIKAGHNAKKDGFKPPIVVVGTHIDQLQEGVEEGIVIFDVAVYGVCLSPIRVNFVRVRDMRVWLKGM